LLQETLAAAYRGGALSLRATEAVAVDTTVQEKAIAHPTEHGLLLTAIEQLGRQGRRAGLRLRQSYVRGARRKMHRIAALSEPITKRLETLGRQLFFNGAELVATRLLSHRSHVSRHLDF
jgi:hypothetical protein